MAQQNGTDPGHQPQTQYGLERTDFDNESILSAISTSTTTTCSTITGIGTDTGKFIMIIGELVISGIEMGMALKRLSSISSEFKKDGRVRPLADKDMDILFELQRGSLYPALLKKKATKLILRAAMSEDHFDQVIRSLLRLSRWGVKDFLQFQLPVATQAKTPWLAEAHLHLAFKALRIILERKPDIVHDMFDLNEFMLVLAGAAEPPTPITGLSCLTLLLKKVVDLPRAGVIPSLLLLFLHTGDLGVVTTFVESAFEALSTLLKTWDMRRLDSSPVAWPFATQSCFSLLYHLVSAERHLPHPSNDARIFEIIKDIAQHRGEDSLESALYNVLATLNSNSPQVVQRFGQVVRLFAPLGPGLGGATFGMDKSYLRALLPRQETLISALIEASQDIEELFDELEKMLARFGRRTPGKREPPELKGLMSDWEATCAACNNLLYRSRQAAGKVETASLEFSTFCRALVQNQVIPEPGGDDVQTAVTQHTQIMSDSKKACEDVSKAYKDFGYTLEAFWNGKLYDFCMAHKPKSRIMRSGATDSPNLDQFDAVFKPLLLKLSTCYVTFDVLADISSEMSGFTRCVVLHSETLGKISHTDSGKDKTGGGVFFAEVWGPVSVVVREVEVALSNLAPGAKFGDELARGLSEIQGCYKNLEKELYRYQIEVLRER